SGPFRYPCFTVGRSGGLSRALAPARSALPGSRRFSAARKARNVSSTVSSPPPAVRAASAERATSAGGGDEGVFDIPSRYGQGLTRTPHRRPFPPPPRLRLHNDPKRGRRRGARESGAQATVKSTFASPGSVAPP